MEPGVWQILIVVAIIVLFFGAKKIPELAKGIGQGMTEFKKATNMKSDDDKQVEDNREQEVHQQPRDSDTADSQKTRQKAKSE
jgi:sec-independent protein translocase protein TatA